jgi:hypothetical protein
MDFFSEFNNLQKEIFKNIFANSSKAAAADGKVKPNSPAKVKRSTRVTQSGKIEKIAVKNEPKLRGFGEKILNQPTLMINPQLLTQNQQIMPQVLQNHQNFAQLVKFNEKPAGKSPKVQKQKKSSPKPQKPSPPPPSTILMTPETSIEASADDSQKLKTKSKRKNSQKLEQLDENYNKLKRNIYETPRRSFSVPLDSNEKNLRRGRSKYRRSSAGLSPETPQKVLEEVSQEEYMLAFGMKRRD